MRMIDLAGTSECREQSVQNRQLHHFSVAFAERQDDAQNGLYPISYQESLI
jgi:hypothetical protein